MQEESGQWKGSSELQEMVRQPPVRVEDLNRALKGWEERQGEAGEALGG